MLMNDKIPSFNGIRLFGLTWIVSIGIMMSIPFISCADKYMHYKNQYQFSSKDKKPDYSDLNYWAAHPLKKDPSDSIPRPLQQLEKDSLVDVFFLHPTMYTGKIKDGKLNADIDDAYLNAKTDYSTILYQASVFNQHAKIYAPRFREAHISAYYPKDSTAAFAAFDLAYEDVKAAFEYYLKNFNNGRPIIIASHSQGTTHAIRLLKDYFENKPLQKHLVTAYLVGMVIPNDFYSSLKFCEEPEQTNCYCGWRTFRKGFLPPYVKNENGNSFVVNPITWKTNNEFVSRKKNTGSVLYKFNKLYKKTTGAQIHDGVIWTRKPKFPWSFLYFTKNYHAGDINLYYMNLKENIGVRIDSYFRK